VARQTLQECQLDARDNPCTRQGSLTTIREWKQ